MSFRNIAIIAHVDHGKTTLVDGILRQCQAFSDREQRIDRVMDSMDLERERGITIASKNTAVHWKDIKINILDTPGHADFGGEVERVLSMVEGALLLVDASEGPLPQTRFVLQKALEANLEVLLCINKIDRPDARADEVLDEVYDLFIDLGADDDMLNFAVLYACARDGVSHLAIGDESTDLTPLLDTIIQRVPPPRDPDADTHPRILITNLGYDPYVGRLAIGRLFGGALQRNTRGTLFAEDGTHTVRIPHLFTWDGLERVEAAHAERGDIIAVAGIPNITVGDTVAIGEDPHPLPRITVDEPTIGMTFSINTSPFAGQDGRFLTSRQIRERIDRELLSNVSLRLIETDNTDAFRVYARGELQLAVLIEQMRREGYELTVSRPEVVHKDIDGTTMEPWEIVTIDVPDEFMGAVTQRLGQRRAVLEDMMTDGQGRTRVIYRIPSRGLIGFRGIFLTETRGEGVLNTLFDGWHPIAGHITNRARGAMVADRAGKTTTYALFHLQPRGELFVGVGIPVYEGMVIGEHKRENDLNVNITREKQLTNFRSANADEKQILSPPRQLTLELAMDFIDDDELIEVTPNALRIRKRVLNSSGRSIVRRPRPGMSA